jgi:hypothetical protein
VASEVGVHGGDRHRERIRDRHQQVGGDVLEAALDLGQVGGRASSLAGDLAEATALALAMSAKDPPELAADLVGCYAQSRMHNAHSISPSAGTALGDRGRDELTGILAERWRPYFP